MARKRLDLTRDSPSLLPLGSTYAHWPIDGYAGGGRYHTRCPRCDAKMVKDKVQMTKLSGCAGCAKRHRGSVSR